MKEAAIITRAAQFPKYHPFLQLGIEDDTALFLPEVGYRYAWSVDTLVENTHFLREMPAEAVGWKSLAVNLSDLAAMNATPQACLLSLALPADLDDAWIHAFFDGLQHCCETYQIDLAGGDTVRQQSEINISVSVLGKTRHPLTRKGAKPGDLIIVTGTDHGAAANGLKDFQAGVESPWIKSLYYPIPRFEAAKHLAALDRAQVLDTSDSLLTSARLLAQLNQLGCEIDAEQIPVSAALKAYQPDFLNHALTGGEDFELMAAIAPESLALLNPHEFTVIGQLTAMPQKYTLHHDGKSLTFSEWGEGFTHF
jgi:thiamine-monophosphate kinase